MLNAPLVFRVDIDVKVGTRVKFPVIYRSWLSPPLLMTGVDGVGTSVGGASESAVFGFRPIRPLSNSQG